jgi:hypothetical protein
MFLTLWTMQAAANSTTPLNTDNNTGVALAASGNPSGMRPSIVATWVPHPTEVAPPPLTPLTTLPYIAEPGTTPMASHVPQWGPYVHQDGRTEPRNTSIHHTFNLDLLSLPRP